ncbi:ATP synthase subunit d, mitochondrial isoform X1 [Lucilia cuprina]|uniref:ATP synthase subunit d, mitochondrial isoform X1 n=1 Tax=Lucilia cuprina TaxID=7375 RepID=UPI001F0698A2|nr:ATP synthase subunit d, mitochondrial isoform X1 [Lucilia cuprina]
MATKTMAELLKRVPPNQMKQFEAFRAKTLEYNNRVNQYPDKLPTIDWEYYRNNVQEGKIKMVEQFQIKYEELKHVFSSRHKVLDHAKYYVELKKLTAHVQEEVNKFIEDSINRIRIYEDEMRRIKALRYENMTLEQFIEEREDIAKFIPGQGKALFWPHNAEEQLQEAMKLNVKDGGDKSKENPEI